MQNELTSKILESVEPEENLEFHLNKRVADIPSYGLLGPPDLCYLIKEKKTGTLSTKTTRAGYYHFVYGVDTSSSASIAAYITSVMNLAGSDTNYFPKPKCKVKVTNGYFCMFDAISRRDYRVEITFPGSTNVVAIDRNGERHMINDKEWSNVLLCS